LPPPQPADSTARDAATKSVSGARGTAPG
jgi:hypothetical protein